MTSAALPRFALARRYTRGTPLAVAGLAALLAIAAAALSAPLLAVHDPYDLSAFSILDARLEPGEATFARRRAWLGTDDQGRDFWSAILFGLRISLAVAAISGLCAAAIGTTLGVLAGYRGGWTDRIVMRIVDIQISIPAILVALVTVQWVYFARTVRASVLTQRSLDYVSAGRLMGFSDARLMVRHILPNCLGPLWVVATIEFAHAITLEATLSFLGVCLPITEPSLGRLISNGFAYLQNGEWWISLLPGAALLALIFSINLVADRLRAVTGAERGLA